MPYTPINANVYFAAYEGAYAGMAASGRVPLSSVPSNDAPWAELAGAYARAFDTQWGVVPATTSDVENMRGLSAGVWQERSPAPSTVTDSAAFYAPIVAGVIALVQEAAIFNAGIPTPSGGGGIQNFTIYRPGLPSGGPFVATEAEVEALANAAGGAFTVYVDSSLAPATIAGVLEGQSRLTLSPARGPVAGTAMRLTILDGGQLRHPAGVSGQLEVVSNTTTIPALLVNNSNVGVFLSNGALLTLGAGATRPFIDVSPGAGNIVAFRLDFSSKYRTLAAGVPFADLLAAGAGFTNFYTGVSPFTQPDNNTVRGPVGSVHILVYDNSIPVIPVQAFFAGTYLKFPIDSGQVLGTVVDYTLASMQAFGGIAVTTVFPAFAAGGVANARLLAPESETVVPLNSPAMTASDAQVIDDLSNALTGIADTFTGGTGFTAPYPAFMRTSIPAPTLPQYLITITGDTFTNITAGHVRARLEYTQTP
jgi:hypothetical protein